MAALKPLFKPTTARPASTLRLPIPRQTLLFNNFQHSSWLLVAALLQGLLTWYYPTVLTLLPSLLILTYRALDVVLIMAGVRKNPYMEGALLQRVSAQIPNDRGEFGEKPARKTVVVLLLGSRSNHPLGILYPAYQKMGSFFEDMTKDLESNREDYGFITSSTWLSNSDANRNAARELMTVFYFQSVEGLHKFATAPAHRRGWDWWNRTVKEHPDLSIMHEMWEAPAGRWENIYLNYPPSGFATGKFPIKVEKGESETQWISNIVDASRTNMKSATMRMGRE